MVNIRFCIMGTKRSRTWRPAQSAKQIASVLNQHGIAQKDRVLVCMPNRPDVIFSYQGILLTGAIVIPVMFLLHPQEIHYILKDLEAEGVITSRELFPKIAEAVKGLVQPPKIFVVDDLDNE